MHRHLEICCWFSINLHWEADFLCTGSGQSGEIEHHLFGCNFDQVDTITCLDDCLLHQNPFVICKGISCFWSVSICPSQIFYTCYSTTSDLVQEGRMTPLSLTCWTELVPCPWGMSVETEKNLWWMKMTWDILDLICCVLLSLGWRKWSNEIIKESNLMSVVVFWF